MSRAFETVGMACVLAVTLCTVYALGGWALLAVYLGVQVPLGIWIGRRLRCREGA